MRSCSGVKTDLNFLEAIVTIGIRPVLNKLEFRHENGKTVPIISLDKG